MKTRVAKPTSSVRGAAPARLALGAAGWAKADAARDRLREILRPTSPIVQRKLAVGDASDPLEREADRVADEMVGMPEPEPAGAAASAVQAAAPPPATDAGGPLRRSCAACSGGQRCAACDDAARVQRREDGTASSEITEAPAIVDDVLRGSGQPLGDDLLGYFEPRFGTDFHAVQVHTGGLADASARAVNAQAYTVGHDIVFGHGHYAPHTTEGRRLLAHELTHVVQQSGGALGGPAIQRAPAPEVQPPRRLPIPESIRVTWGGDPFVIRVVLRQAEDFGHNDLVFQVRYVGDNEVEGGDRVFDIRVPLVDSLDEARLIENHDPQATRIEIDLAPEQGGSVTAALTDTVVEKIVPGRRGGRDHAFHTEKNHHDAASAMSFVVIDKQIDQRAKAMPPRKPGEPYWTEKPVTPPGPKPDYVPPGKATAEPAHSVSDIWSVDVTLGGFYDKFRITIQPTSATTALFGLAAMQGGSVNGGGGALLTGKAPFAPALVAARGNTIALGLHGSGTADLTLTDSISVPKADISVVDGGTGASGQASRDRDHKIKVSGAEIGGDSTFEFLVRDGVNLGSRYRGVSDLDIRAMANAAAVTAIPKLLALGSVEEEAERYDDALFEQRKSAHRLGAIPDPVFDNYGVVYVVLRQIREQLRAPNAAVDSLQQSIAAKYAVKLTDSVNDETKRSPVYGDDGKRLSAAIARGDWATTWTLWRGVVQKLDGFILDRMKDKLGKQFFGTKDFATTLGAKQRVDDLHDKRDVVHLAALYFPDPKYRSQRDMLTAIPLSIYYFREDGKWKLKDYSDPDRDPVKHEVDDNGKAEPPEELFTQLDHLTEYPRGIIRWQIPGGSSGSFATTDKQTTGEKVQAWLGRIALAAGAIGLALTGVGAIIEIGAVSTLGTVFLAASAVAGAGAAAVDIYEKARQGTLTAMDAVIDVAQIVASLASLGTIPRGYFISQLARGIALTGRAAKVAELALDVYVPLRAINLGADVVTVMAVSKQTFDQLDRIKQLPIDQQNEAWIVTIAQLFVTAGLSIVSIKGAAGEMLEGTPRITLRIDERGIPIAELEEAAAIGRTSRFADKQAEIRQHIDEHLDRAQTVQPYRVEVLTPAEFTARFHSEKGRSMITLVEDGHAVVYARADASTRDFADEAVHLVQLNDPSAPKLAENINTLSEATLGQWRKLDVDVRKQLFERKLAVEIDAKQRRLAELTSGAPEWQPLHDELSNLQTLETRSHAITDEQLLAFKASGKVPDFLEDPAWLFAKETTTTVGTNIRQPGVDLSKLATKVVTDSPAKAFGTVKQIGEPWTETTIITSSNRGKVKVETNAISVDGRRYVLEDGARLHVKTGDDVRPGQLLATEAGEQYRLVNVEKADGTTDHRLEYHSKKRGGWVQAGEHSTRRGARVEQAARNQISEELAAEKRAAADPNNPASKDPNRLVEFVRVDNQTPQGGGFDDVVIEFRGDPPTATIRIVEVKDYPNRSVSMGEMTAIRENRRANLRRLRAEVRSAVAAGTPGARPAPFRNLTEPQISALADGMRENNFRVELRLGPSTSIGAEGRSSNTILSKLRAELKASRDFGGRDVLETSPPRMVDQKAIDALPQ